MYIISFKSQKQSNQERKSRGRARMTMLAPNTDGPTANRKRATMRRKDDKGGFDNGLVQVLQEQGR